MQRGLEIGNARAHNSQSPPATSAAPVANASQPTPAGLAAGVALAEELEGTRRAFTLGGALFLIPATAAVVTVAAAGLGVSGVFLGICALTGLAIGPGLCLASLAASNLVGRPLVRRAFKKRAREMGLASGDVEIAWHRAEILLNDQARRRLGARATLEEHENAKRLVGASAAEEVRGKSGA